jgi:signal transduction histidine kinase
MAQAPRTHTVSQLMNAAVPQETSLRLEPVELPVLVQRVCHYYQRFADRKHLHILYRSSGEVPQVWTDCVAVVAVLDNLLSNAVNYSPPASVSGSKSTETRPARAAVSRTKVRG